MCVGNRGDLETAPRALWSERSFTRDIARDLRCSICGAKTADVMAWGGHPSDAASTKLMRAAFDPNAGPLTDKDAPASEREALAHFFTGAIGYFRNPAAHHDVGLDNPIIAREMIMVASNLLRIADARGIERMLS